MKFIPNFTPARAITYTYNTVEAIQESSGKKSVFIPQFAIGDINSELEVIKYIAMYTVNLSEKKLFEGKKQLMTVYHHFGKRFTQTCLLSLLSFSSKIT